MKGKFIRTTFLALFCSISASQLLCRNAEAEEERTYLLGDWGGSRTYLEEHGVSFESVLTTEFVADVSGGLERRSTFLGNYDLTASLDTEKASMWKGGTLFTYVLADFGESAADFIGDTQGTSNIEAPESIKLYEAWYNQDLLDGRLSFLLGLHDYNSEFDALDYAGTLRNSSFGISPDISQVGPSIFPTTSMAFRVRVKPSDPIYVQAAIYDGVPGNPNNPRGTHIILRHSDGAFMGAEVGAISEVESDKAGYYKAGMGYWYTNTDFEDFAGNFRSENSGVYGIAEKSLWSPDGETAGLGGFIQFGFARPERNQIGAYFGGGFAYTGLIASRADDIATFGVAYARNSGKFKDATDTQNSGETVLELAYHAEVAKYLAIQPDIQYIISPGTDSSVDDALVLSTRLEIAF